MSSGYAPLAVGWQKLGPSETSGDVWSGRSFGVKTAQTIISRGTDKTHVIGREAVKNNRVRRTLEVMLLSREQAGKFPSTLSSDRQQFQCRMRLCLLLAGHEEIALRYFLES